MSNLEKINIYVPSEIIQTLDYDAVMFEVFKKDMHTINRNKFLTMLILGYHDAYASVRHQTKETIGTILSSSCSDKAQVHDLSRKILNSVFLSEYPRRNLRNSAHLSLKPTNDLEPLLYDILNELDGDSVSQYFCNMLISYCGKPFSKREQIIFNDQYSHLLAACEKCQTVSFSTLWNPKAVHHVIPYQLKTGRDEQFNYLLCAEIVSDRQTAISYRLNRITGIHNSRKTIKLEDDVKKYLDQMARLGPQYTINDKEEACIRLTDTGMLSFKKIYSGRPVCDRIEHRDGYYYYYFNCSKDQLYFYFRKFNANQAEVLYPQSLRDKIIEFHRGSLEIYR